jgi:hypothetical protein
MPHDQDESRQYVAPKLSVLGTVQDLTRMPPQVGKNKETHPGDKGSKLQ